MVKMDVSVIFSSPNATYSPNQQVGGEIVLILEHADVIEKMKVKVKGKAKVCWEEPSNFQQGKGNFQNRDTVYEGKEKIFRRSFDLLSTGSVKLEKGQYHYPFGIMLPGHIPSSFEGEFGHVQYIVVVKVIACSLRMKKKVPFLVDCVYNLNWDPSVWESVQQEVSKTFCHCCCLSSPLTLSVSIPRSGYCPGEPVPLSIVIDNGSFLVLESVKSELIEITRWVTHKPSKKMKESRKYLFEKSLGHVRHHSERSWKEVVPIPVNRVPDLSSCNIISILHTLRITAVPRGLHSNLELEIPLKIGSSALPDDSRNTFPFLSICPRYEPH